VQDGPTRFAKDVVYEHMRVDLKRRPSASRERKALQNTGLRDFRQSQFVDTRYTLGYTWGFLAVSGEVAAALAVVLLLETASRFFFVIGLREFF
jgi:hypothetical protein